MMKKVVLSLFMAVACLPMAISQTADRPVVSVNETACGSYTWNVTGETYNQDTVVTHITPDTIYVLELAVSMGTADTNEAIELEGSCFATWNGHKFFTQGTQIYAIPTASGCDSLVKLDVTLTGSSDTTIVATACGSYHASWNQNYTTSGTYTHVDSNACRNYTLVLTINPIYNDTAAVVVQDVTAGCYYRFGDSTFTDSNHVHMAYLASVDGCDSLAAIRITHYTRVQNENNVVNYCGTNYQWPIVSNRTYSQAGTYDTTFFDAASNCTYNGHLVLTFGERDSVINDGPFCAQKTYSFRNSDAVTYTKTLTETTHASYYEMAGYDNDPNLYIRNLGTGCITRVTMNVEIWAPEQRYNDTIDTVACDSYTFRVGTGAAGRETYKSSGTYSLTYNRHVADVVISDYSQCYDLTGVVNLTINHSTGDTVRVVACDSYTWAFNGITYTKDTTGSVTLRDPVTDTLIKNMYGCDSVGRLTLTVNKSPNSHIDGNWMLQPGESTTLTAVSDMTGVTYRWEVDGELLGNSETLTVEAPSADENNKSVKLVTTKGYSGGNSCSTESWLTIITLFPNGIEDVDGMDVNVYPNPASRVVTLSSEVAISEVEVFNAIGQQVMRVAGNGNYMQIDLGNLTNGQYTLRVSAADGMQTTRRLIVNK